MHEVQVGRPMEQVIVERRDLDVVLPQRARDPVHFVMIADEVNRVARALRKNDIQITALHNHLLHGSPDLYFMHFWAVGDDGNIATGLKSALGGLKKSK